MGIISEVRDEINKPENASKYVQPPVVYDGFVVELYNKRAKRRNMSTLLDNAAPQAVEAAVNSFKYQLTRMKKIPDPDHNPGPKEDHRTVDKEYKVDVDEGVAIIGDIIHKHPDQKAANLQIANQLNQKTKPSAVTQLTKNQVFELIDPAELNAVTQDITDKLDRAVGYPADPHGSTLEALFDQIGPLSKAALIDSRIEQVPFFSKEVKEGYVAAARAML